jgi:geranylgeranyl reductase family protein
LAHYPVIILGAGPAGCGSSFFLSKAGVRHLILEKDRFPRDKVCGDACSGKTAYVLRTANPAWLHEIFARTTEALPSTGITFVAPNGRGLEVHYPVANRPGEPAPGFTMKRMDFDNALFEKLDSKTATVVQSATPRSISRKPEGGWEVRWTENGQEHTATADLIIGADGDKGISRKTLLSQGAAEKAYSVGLRAYYQGVTGFNEGQYLELHFLRDVLPGYFWVFPMTEGRANVGIGMLSQKVRAKKVNLREVMLRAIATHPALKSRFANAQLEGKILGWGLPMCTGQDPLSGDGYMLTGDAASLIDPFSGEGIGYALYSGMLAANAAVTALEEGRTDAATLRAKYDKELWRRIGSELRISYTLQRLSGYPWLMNMVVNKAAKSSALRDTISGMFADINMRERLRKPSFYFDILLNR